MFRFGLLGSFFMWLAKFIWRRRLGYQCYALTAGSRERLLEAYRPKFAKVTADHVTHNFGVPASEELPPEPRWIEVVGYACDDSLECVIVEVDGKLQRPDGGTYHITISREPHRQARESNDLIAGGWQNKSGLFLAAKSEFKMLR